jgi:hypothetical protein
LIIKTPLKQEFLFFNSTEMKLLRALKSIFTLDLRALALMRICLGMVIFLDLCIRLSDLKAHYSDEGLLPLDLLFHRAWDPWNISIHTISGLWQVQLLLFLIAAFFALLLIAGYRTKLSSIVSWFLLLSLQNRNPFILQGGDGLLLMILFWGMFLPWGNCYSLDSVIAEKNTASNSWFGIAGIGYILQIASVYFFSALLKMPSPEWTSEGTAIYYALSIDQMVFPAGKLIYPYFDLLRYLTFFVFYLELFAPFLFFIPVYNSFFRSFAIILLTILHVGIACTLFVGLFFIIGIVTLIGLFPPAWTSLIDKKIMLLKTKMSFHRKIITALRHVIPHREPAKTGRSLRSFTTALLSGAIIYTLVWNWQTTSYSNFKITGQPKEIGQLLGINQSWGMFSPNVFKDDGWYIFEAKTKRNAWIDIGKEGKPIQYIKPVSIVSFFKNDRWRKYSENYLMISNCDIRPYYCDFLINEWNSEHENDPVKELKIIYMKEVTRPGYLFAKPTREVLAVYNKD